ncbi:integral membrane protein [Histoplasma capsulatum G186AR]|uniref:Integral membrane protein n=1 Tax=Ajellomyces capsulatus TaxID=5037 RepID=A0A8H7YJT3_AJECA|nr:integral membrane protein [Histoplasma capsulatum]QSS68581.1 integral membrane protein [Histoplasma capsulatum G186AR]
MAPLNELHTFTRRHAPFHSGVTDLVVVQLLMPSIAILLVANRVYFRVKLAKVLAWDDYAIIAAIISCIAMNTIPLVGVSYGYGKPWNELSKSQQLISMKLFWAVQIAYKSTLNICKMSILLLYRRIFATRKFQIAVNIVFVFVVLYFIASVAANLLECRPVAKNFDMSIPGKCINVTAHWLANAISTSSSDIVTLLLPMPVIHRLRLPPRQKYGLMCIFALGIFVCVISVIRMTTIPFGSQAHDRSKGTVNTLMWAMVEANTSIICACLPMLRTPLSMLFPTLFPPFHYGGETLSHQSSITAAEAAGISEDPEQMQEEQMLKSSKSLLKTTTIQVSISQKNEEGPRSPGEREMEKGACPLPSTEKQGGDDTPFDISAPRPMTPLLPLSSSPVTPLPSPPPYGSNTTSNVGE